MVLLRFTSTTRLCEDGSGNRTFSDNISVKIVLIVTNTLKLINPMLDDNPLFIERPQRLMLMNHYKI